MLTISAQQLAELLSGIARAQAAVINGVEGSSPGTRSSHVMPALRAVAHLHDHPSPTLTDLPVRVLLAYMGRVSPDMALLQRDIERLLGTAQPAAASPAAAPDSADALDFSAKPAGGAS